jgi:ArsR family transcriptional regulator
MLFAEVVAMVSIQTAAELLKAFSHPTRLAILNELAVGPKCVTDIEDLLDARQANISQHLAVLRHSHLVDYAQDGTLRCYYLTRPRLVHDMLALVARDEPVVKRTAAEIQADKERHAKAMEKKSRLKKKSAQSRKRVTK